MKTRKTDAQRLVDAVEPLMSKPPHTPTPWKISEGGIEDAEGTRIASVPFDTAAVYIVRAVNAHEGLIQTLENVESWLRDGFFDKTENKCRSKADEITQALAQAEGR